MGPVDPMMRALVAHNTWWCSVVDACDAEELKMRQDNAGDGRGVQMRLEDARTHPTTSTAHGLREDEEQHP